MLCISKDAYLIDGITPITTVSISGHCSDSIVPDESNVKHEKNISEEEKPAHEVLL